MPISAPPPSWASIKNKPNTVSGFGITDMANQSVASATNATNASAVPWSGVSSKPNTVAGFGITDLQAAINALTGFANSVGSSGYQKLPSGLIIQWGYAAYGTTVTFPIAFPSVCSSITLGGYAMGGGVPRIDSFTRTSFVYSSASSGGANAYYMAVGY